MDQADGGSGSAAKEKAGPAAMLALALLLIIPVLAVLGIPGARGYLGSHPLLLPAGVACLGLGMAALAMSVMRIQAGAARLAQDLHAMAEDDDPAAIQPVQSWHVPGLASGINRLLERVDTCQRESIDVLASSRVLARELDGTLGLIESMNDGIVAVSGAHKVLFASEAAAPFLTMSPDEARGQRAEECIAHPRVVSLLAADEAEGPGHGGGLRSVELPPDKASGRGHYAVTVTQAGGDDEGTPGQMLVFRDVDRVKKLERLQTEFVEGLADELRGPLAAIRADVRALVCGREAGPNVSRYRSLDDETSRLSRVIDNLFNFAMLQSGAMKLDMKPTHLDIAIIDAVEDARPQAEEKGIALNVDLPGRLPSLDIDKRLFDVALANLLDNAVKYTGPGGTITVSTAPFENEFHVNVRDTGIGISEEEQSRIFEKFYETESLLERVQGKGAGLAAALQMARLHGGDIRVSSKIGQGSCFSIVLPRDTIAVRERA